MNVSFSGESASRHSIVEPVTDTPHGNDMTRPSRVVFELAAQLEHVRVDSASDHRRRISPHCLHEIEPRADFAAMAQQLDEQVVFLRTQRDFRTRAQDAARCRIDFYGAE